MLTSRLKDDLVSIKAVKSKFTLTFWAPKEATSKKVITLFGHKVAIRKLHARISHSLSELNIPRFVERL
jgi:phosphopantetheinyl transferase (holo-ACP synthase)